MPDPKQIRDAKRAAERTGLIAATVIFAVLGVGIVLLATVGGRAGSSIWIGAAALLLGAVSLLRLSRRRGARYREEDAASSTGGAAQ